ncbi:MAG: hypothetical protein QOF37_1139 [Thermoleophilaceae bacterium]|nr:hypothetical protein [Thermoleophilaceae bacterium]
MFGRNEEEPSPQARLAGAGAYTAPVAPAEGGEARGPREGLILLLFAVLTLAASAYVVAKAERDIQHDPSQKAARGEISGLDKLSLIRAPNLRRVLAAADAGPRPLVANIRVAPARVDLILRDAGGSRKSVSVDPGFKTKESDFGVGTDDAIRASRLDASGPERMLRAVTERTGLGPGAVDYVTLSPLGLGQTGWYMFLKQGSARDRQWAAAMDGTDLRHPGDPSKGQRAVQKRQRAIQNRLQRVVRQRTACLRSAADAQAAARCIERFQP